MKKTADILLATGFGIIIVGLITSVIMFFCNSVIALSVFLLSIIAGGGCASIAGNLNEAQQEKADDLQLLNEIIERIRTEQDLTPDSDK